MGSLHCTRDDMGADSALEPIAICGMAARLPGQVNTPSELWDMLLNKRNGLVDWPRNSTENNSVVAGRFNADGFQSKSPRKGTFQAAQAYLLNHVSLGDFDASFFPVSAKEAARMDPMHRQLLEVAYECAENAGAARNLFAGNSCEKDRETRRDVGVFVGVFGEDWLEENAMDSQLAGLYRGTGFMDFLQANRVSFAMDWQGPSVVVKSGCSASLVALNMACQSLRSGECSAAVVLGVNIITSPLMTLLYTDQGLLSPTGRCKTFDVSADGYGRGEAVNGVYLKRLSDAMRDRDPIRAVVRASATGHDGRKSGQLKPEAAAQEALIRKTYRLAGIDQYEETAWVECHGTGTVVGDPIELRAIGNVFGHAGVIVGAVKPNVGHSEGAAGLTGLIKAVLSLEHKIIPPNIFFEKPNPLKELAKPRNTSRLNETNFSLPCCCALQIAIVNILRAWGVLPVAVVGHSSGEVASAYAAGALSASEAIIAAYLRGMVFDSRDLGMSQPGAMAAVGLGPEQTLHFLGPGAVVACENSDISTTISGDRDAVEEVLKRIQHENPNVPCRMLRVKTAFHSHHAFASAARYEELLAPFLTQNRKISACRLYTSVYGSLMGESGTATATTKYWRDSLVQPVYFRQALGHLIRNETLLEPGSRLLLVEIGPHPSLEMPVKQTIRTFGLGSAEPTHIPTLRRDERADVSILKSAGELFMRGALDDRQLAAIMGANKCSCLTDLPPYAWYHGTQYFDPPRVASVYKNAKNPPHEILGARVPDTADVEPCWRNVLEPSAHPSWLTHHVVDNQVVFPAAGFVAMAGEAVRQLSPSSFKGYALRRVSIKTPLIVPPGSKVELLTRLTEHEDYGTSGPDVGSDDQQAWYDFHIMAVVPDRDGNLWTSHCRGLVRSGKLPSSSTSSEFGTSGHTQPSEETDDYHETPSKFRRRVGKTEWYAIADAVGLKYGESLQTLESISASTVRLAASASTYIDDKDEDASFETSPALIDTGFQLGLVAMCQGLRRKCNLLLVPSFISEIEVNEADIVHEDDNKYHHLDGNAGDLEMLAMVRWLKRGRSLQGTVSAFTSRVGHPRRFLMRDITFSAKPRGPAANALANLRLLSSFDWAADVELLDMKKPLSVAQLLELMAFKNPRLRVVCIGHDGDIELGCVAMRALQARAAPQCHANSTLTYAAMTGTELQLARNAFECYRDADPPPSFLDLTTLLNLGQFRTENTEFDVLLVDGADTFIDSLMILGRELFVSLLASFGWLVVRDSAAEVDLQLEEELGFKCLCQCSGEGISVARSLPPAQSHEAIATLTDTNAVNTSIDNEDVCSTNSIPRITSTIRVKLLSQSLDRELEQTLKESLRSCGIPTEICLCSSAGAISGKDKTIKGDEVNVVTLSLLCLQSPTVASLNSSTFQSFIRNLASAHSPLIWVLPVVQADSTVPIPSGPEPDGAFMLGLSRTARNECAALDLTTVEVDMRQTSVLDVTSALVRIVQRLDRRQLVSTGAHVEADRELRISLDGTIQIPRMAWRSVSDEIQATFPREAQVDEPNEDPMLFHSDASYLLVGGLGGLGMSVSRWMAEMGARHLVFLSRTAAEQDPEKQSFIEELASMGCAATCVTGRAEVLADVERAITAAEVSPGRRLRGVLHMPMVLRDRPMSDMTWEDWSAVVDPKVRGAQNLHDALQRRDVAVDFFVLVSSVSGIVGQRGQANYNAANVYLDAFAHYRRGLGLPASVLDLGIVGHVGAVARNDRLMAHFRNAGYVFLGEDDIVRTLAILMRPSAPPQLVLGLVADPETIPKKQHVIWERDPRMSRALTSGPASSGDGTKDSAGSDIRELITCAKERPAELTTEERRVSLATMLGRVLCALLVKPPEQLSLTATMESLGLDSFTAVELSSWIQERFDIDMPPKQTQSGVSLMRLAEKVMAKLLAKHQPGQLAKEQR
ncbi:Lovastatin nonaketide synthase 3 [Colletotrichum chlorophyti]|uniref:Lovastatin nonaketide synthase 3 n=1 Tax=Colletotrichum chlorophyti TaxID=708187 RepID=A0A1Q8S421_9PEZI|nr:Lovastatin nonaketide synthase 3 [Colletotrichum chlorophyti]